MRDYLISLYCRRNGLLEKQGRGVDQLPPTELLRLESTLIKSMELQELQRVFHLLTQLCLEEIEIVDKDLRKKIEPTLLKISER